MQRALQIQNNERGIYLLDTLISLFMVATLVISSSYMVNSIMDTHLNAVQIYNSQNAINDRILQLQKLSRSELEALTNEQLSSNPIITCNYTTTQTLYNTTQLQMNCTINSVYPETISYKLEKSN